MTGVWDEVSHTDDGLRGEWMLAPEGSTVAGWVGNGFDFRQAGPSWCPLTR